MLELRPCCENSGADLPPQSTEALICSFECTFCADCVNSLQNVCPNCGGGFSARPIRPAARWRDDNYLGAKPASIHRLVRAAVHGGSSLYVLDEVALADARPDLIITQELCRVCAVSYREVNEVARAIDAEITVLSLEPTSIEGILNTIGTVGAMTEAEDAAVDLVESLRERLGAIEETVWVPLILVAAAITVVVPPPRPASHD